MDNIETLLSSNYLYHYTKSFQALKSILLTGFRYHLIKEDLQYDDPSVTTQSAFVSCFCDLLPSDAARHRSVYGSYGIALRKEWGMRNSITPVRYVHKNSAGLSKEYMAIRSIWSRLQENPDANEAFLKLIPLSSVYRPDNSSTPLIELRDLTDQECAVAIADRIALTELIKKNPHMTRAFNGLMMWVTKLHGELQQRDSLLRIHDFYDESEWRAVFQFPWADVGTPDYLEAINTGWASDSRNLRFSDSDVTELIVVDENELAQLSEYLVIGGGVEFSVKICVFWE